MQSDFIFTTPVAQANITGRAIGAPIEIDPSSGVTTVPIVPRTAAGPTAAPGTTLTITLTVADMQTILGVITARGVASGVIAAAGSVTVA
jgi:hypothetical protein